jgi:cytochrome c-type protein NapC
MPQLPQLRWHGREKQKLRAPRKHKIGAADKKTCIDCHKGIAHKKPKGMKEDDDE